MNKSVKLALAVLAINVLSGGGLASLATAQTTPSTYCASLGNPSCEVLNVEPIGLDSSTNLYFMLKVCVNGAFATRIIGVLGMSATPRAEWMIAANSGTYYQPGFIGNGSVGMPNWSGANYGWQGGALLDFAKSCF